MEHKKQISVNGAAVNAQDLTSSIGEGIIYLVLTDKYQKFELSGEGFRALGERRDISVSVEDFLDHMQLAKEGIEGAIIAYVTSEALPSPDDYSLQMVDLPELKGKPVFVYSQKPDEPKELSARPMPEREPLRVGDIGSSYAAVRSARKKGIRLG